MWTLMVLKPDVVAHPVLLQVAVRELLSSGVEIAAARRLRISPEQAQRLYGCHREKFFYQRLVRHVTSGPSIALRVRGDVRSVLGSSRLWPLAECQTLRQRLALSDVRNVAHASDEDAAAHELAIFEPLPPADDVMQSILDHSKCPIDLPV